MTLTLTRSEPGMWAWAASRALAARDVPASGAEHAAWTVRGWAEIALGCALLGPAAFDGLDTVVLATRIRRGGPAADRLRALRGRAGPVPRGYPSAEDPGHVEGPGEETREACRRLAAWCATIPDAPARPAGPVRPVRDHLRWGERHRPHATREVVIVDGSRFTGLAWRTWMRLPGEHGPVTVLVDRTHRAPEIRRRVWRGVHDGAHLDHLAACDDEIEFGRGLLAAETYAMAVELVALAETRDAAVRRILRQGVLERIDRISAHPELRSLPTLASAYVTGALGLLEGGGEGVPEKLREPLRARWVRARAGAARCPPSPAPAR